MCIGCQIAWKDNASIYQDDAQNSVLVGQWPISLPKTLYLRPISGSNRTGYL